MMRYFPQIKAALFVACLLPLLHLGWGAWNDTLGANPIEYLTRALGTWTLKMLLVTLAITPLRRLTGWGWLVRLRRMLGLYAFFYGSLHLSCYLWLDQFFDWSEIGHDIVKRPFITAGMTAFALMVPLAATSNHAAIRRLGGARWQRLHRLVYLTGMLAMLHYVWLVKQDVTLPVVYGAILLVLLGFRVVGWLGRLRRMPAAPGRKIIPIALRP